MRPHDYHRTLRINNMMVADCDDGRHKSIFWFSKKKIFWAFFDLCLQKLFFFF